ncbi:acetyl-CoA carboxylase biotin carboxyl carrier protein [Chloracidobacterium sp. MS 40/45]|nr:acetyl-CoA carboxylase biotin carboxyl carrier protein [Chloracidobacterium sp. MS 40/45]
MVNLKEIKELIEFVSGKNIAELEIDKAGLKLRIRTTHLTSTSTTSVSSAAAESDFSPQERKPAAGQSVKEPTSAEGEMEDSTLHVIFSPIVGTFYRASSPDSKPFVEVGSQVSPGTVLCIIEAMKLMNEVESDIAGEIVKIHQENGKPVEFGQPLFSLKRKQ